MGAAGGTDALSLIPLPFALNVDSSEHPWLCETLVSMGARVERLKAADYRWQINNKLYLVQRKSIIDAIESIESGTLGAQVLASLSQGAAIVFLLLELDQGQFLTTVTDYMKVDGHATHFRMTSLLNYLSSMQRYGAVLHLSPDMSSTPDVIRSLMEYTAKPYHDAIYRPTQHLRDDSAQFSTLLTVPQVNRLRGRLLAQEFPTLATVANASEKDLQQIRGVGPATARAIYKHFHTFLETK